jgi:hypothetical protein
MIEQLLARISCGLSIIGSMIVIAACRFPESMWRKKGRQLIFWLSVSDLSTSIVYLYSTFQKGDQNSIQCKTTALLGIFFPVASFIWTDFIALYLYIMIGSRRLKTDEEWVALMKWFHFIAWGISLLCISLVAGFDHAGRDDSKNREANTGGWCWVETHKRNKLIVWEIVGGKLIEWASCFIILPYLYYSTAKTLIDLDYMGRSTASAPASVTGLSLGTKKEDISVMRASSASLSSSNLRSSLLTVSQPERPSALDTRKFRQFYVKMVMS